MAKKKKFRWEDRVELQNLFREGWSPFTLAKETQDFTLYELEKEASAGLDAEDRKKLFWGRYDPMKAVYNKLIEDFDEKSLYEFAKWFRKVYEDEQK